MIPGFALQRVETGKLSVRAGIGRQQNQFTGFRQQS
jgi:hypothetical protein